MTSRDENSKRTRVEPVFKWLRDHAGRHWPARFVELAHGLADPPGVGKLVHLEFLTERRVPPSPQRLAWMVENVERLAPRDGRRWRPPLASADTSRECEPAPTRIAGGT